MILTCRQPLKLRSHGEVKRALSGRARTLRLDLGWTQAELSRRSGVKLGTLRHFERTGAGSIDNMLRLAFAMDADEPFMSMFASRPFRTTADVLRANKPARQRGKRQV